ncbi:resuscitation-promoting factor [Actinotalea sp. C106]|uniref:ubiquitin-like domain-containing protein n=1 Tax=Actinotalea sp. C106 TaxID=2908644 RepID=UPI002027AAF9|nr:resuscitation-promoting factor [Actinotalea sp. C106]
MSPTLVERALPARLRLVAQGLVLGLVVAGTSAFAVLHQTVVLEVDGERTTVSTFGRTVADVLAAGGVEVGDRDLVVPAVDASLVGAEEILVRHAREVVVEVDGEERTVWSTALTVGEVLAELGLRDDDVRTSASRSAPLGRDGVPTDAQMLQLSTPKAVHLVVDGETRELSTAALTVREALREAGTSLGTYDQVSVPVDTPLADGLAVMVHRAVPVTRSETSTEAFETVRSDDPGLDEGTEVVSVRGRAGSSVVTYVAYEAGGGEVARTVLGEVVLDERVDEVIRVGTRTAPEPAVTGEGVWGALAQCESGGRPTVVSSNGLYHGLYQFSVGTWRSVGGSGLPSEATPAEQTERAKALQARSGWGQWPHCSSVLGLR